jgi:hypothetical protein
MPTWLFVSLWIFWSCLALIEVLRFMTLSITNARAQRRRRGPVLHYNTLGAFTAVFFVFYSVFWLSWNLFG